MKGVILAGGEGTRLRPCTTVICKQLLPVYDKPMIYYPLATLLHAGVTKILIITSESEIDKFKNLFSQNNRFGVEIFYETQSAPLGVAHGVLLAENFIGDDNFWFILGDNLFHGPDFGTKMRGMEYLDGATSFAYKVSNPKDYGVVEFSDDNQKIIRIEEKPVEPKSSWAIPGLYRFDKTAFERCRSLVPSIRNELEITDLLKSYLSSESLNIKKVSRGNAWFDLGTVDSLLQAANFVSLVQDRQGMLVGSPEEASYNAGVLSKTFLTSQINNLNQIEYYKKLILAIK